MDSGYYSGKPNPEVAEELGEEEKAFAFIYDVLSNIEETGKPAAPTDTVESKAFQLEEDESVLARVCRLHAKPGARDTHEPVYESELKRRMFLAEERKKAASKHLLADSAAFDVGIVRGKKDEDWLWIISPLLKQVILKLVKPRSSVHIKKSIMCVSPPYRPFINHYTDFENELQGKSEESSKVWKSLDFFLREHMSPYLWQSPRSLQRGGLASYDELWNIFKPNDDMVVVDTLGNKEIHRLVEVRQTSDTGRQYRRTPQITLVLWGLGWDPVKHQIERKVWTFDLGVYSGDKEILLLPIYPLRFSATSQDEESLTAELTLRGIRWREINIDRTGTHRYKGLAFSLDRDDMFVSKSIHSRVIRAERVFINEWGPGKRLGLKTSEVTNRGMKLSPKEEGLDWEKVLNSSESFREWAKYFPSTFSSVDVESKAQDAYLIPINDGLGKAHWDKDLFLKQLVIDDEKRRLLRSLVENRLSGQLRSVGDLISNKGKGIIIVLHGPPGTGKTLVAESIAEFVERPLKYVSVGDVIANPKTIEQTLRKKFEDCAKMNAILLMDEADVVLEARSMEDFRRNAVVTTFLSQLEYFDGIMFLTTNRIGTIDAAFMSRIQVAIHMDTLNENQRNTLWKNWFENENLKLKPPNREALLGEVNKWAEIELNGREIRNTLNIAQSLAFSRTKEDGNMSCNDLKEAAREAQSFRKYFRTESERTKDAAQTLWGWGQQN